MAAGVAGSAPRPPPKLLVFGAGYTGARVLLRFLHEGFRCAATVHSEASAERARAAFHWADVEWHTVTDTMDARERAAVVAGVTHVLATAHPAGGGDPMVTLLGEQLRQSSTLEWVGYLSATSVYGDHKGSTVDESSELHAKGPRALARLAAEEAWMATGLPVRIFRLPGIYGPGRGSLAMARGGTARRMDKPGHTFSRIHVDDIVQSVFEAVRRPEVKGVINVGDDLPCAGHEPVAEACRLLGVPAPPLVPWAEAEASMTPMLKSFYADNKKVSNRRMREELGVLLRYPTYKEGLQGTLLEEERLMRMKVPLDFPARPQWYVLVDHGSTQPASLAAAQHACRLLERKLDLGYVLHASMKLTEDAERLSAVLGRLLAADKTAHINVIPLFVGVPKPVVEAVKIAQESYGDAVLRLGRGLGSNDENDNRLVRLFAGTVARYVDPLPARVLFVDHGSPRDEANIAHYRRAEQLSELIPQPVVACSMEAGGSRSDNMLLESALHACEDGAVLLARVFMLPGAHAGPGGDIDTIVAKVRSVRPGLEVISTPLIAETAEGVALLAEEAMRLGATDRVVAQL